MKAKIKTHLEQHLQVLDELLQCLKREKEILSKGASSDILSMVYQKQQLVRQLEELEAKRLELIGTKTLGQLSREYSEDSVFKTYQQSFISCCEAIEQLKEDNELLTQMARQAVVDRMRFYTETIRQSQGTNNTYARGGAYAKPQRIGSAIMERTL